MVLYARLVDNRTELLYDIGRIYWTEGILMHPKHTQAVPANSKPTYSVANSLVSYYLLIMFSFFTLFLTEQYAHARTDKYWLYLCLSAVLVVFACIAGLISHAEQRRNGAPSPLLRPVTVPDTAFLCFFIFAVISTVFSRYPMDAVTGNLGRNNGLILLTAYTLVYFVLTRLYIYKEYVIAVYLVFSSLVALLTVLNFFYIDPFGLLNGYDAVTVLDFGSTIGNKNTIASFMCLFLPVAVMTLTVSDKRYLQILGGCAAVMAYTGLLCANSSSGILGLIVILPVMGAFAAADYSRLRRYVLALAILFVSGKALMLFALVMGNSNKGFEYMQDFLINSPYLYIPIILFGGLYAVMRLLPGERYPRRAVQGALIALCVLIPLCLLAAVVYFTVFDTQTKLGRYTRILRINNKWGTHRGYMWIKSIEEYGRLSPFGKLFGTGPDTLYKVLEPYFGELLQRYGDSSTDCAHNELLNYLVTQGVLGLLSYLTIIGTVVARAVRTARRNPTVLLFVCAVLCYLAQSVVNLYQPITTPVFFIFLSLAESLNRQDRIRTDTNSHTNPW